MRPEGSYFYDAKRPPEWEKRDGWLLNYNFMSGGYPIPHLKSNLDILNLVRALLVCENARFLLNEKPTLLGQDLNS